MGRVRAQLIEQKITLEVDDEAKDLLAEKGWDPQFGARPLRRTIQNMIEDELAEQLLQGQIKQGSTVKVTVKGDKLEMKEVELVGV